MFGPRSPNSKIRWVNSQYSVERLALAGEHRRAAGGDSRRRVILGRPMVWPWTYPPKLPFFANFDGYIYSYQHGAMKPDQRFYQSSSAWRGGERKILFIDDRKENVVAAMGRGWRNDPPPKPGGDDCRLLEQLG